MSNASTINAALGIDASIDLLTTDPIPNLGDGIYDQMYEKGNQLTCAVIHFAKSSCSLTHRNSTLKPLLTSSKNLMLPIKPLWTLKTQLLSAT
jgi:hypothetical protein